MGALLGCAFGRRRLCALRRRFLATEPTGASHTFTGLTPGSAHSYTVAARDVAGNLSTPSPALPVTLLPANTAPVANADGPYQIPEDAVLTTSAPGLLSNDTDADGDPLTADLVSDVSYGTLVLNANGSFTYTPPSNFSGAATFTYRAFDGLSYSNGVTVTIAVTPVNDSPIANDDTATTAEDTALSVTAANGVLANDSDSDSLLLTASKVASPAHGTLALATNGSYVYTPTANWRVPTRLRTVPPTALLLGHHDRDRHGDAGQRPAGGDRRRPVLDA